VPLPAQNENYTSSRSSKRGLRLPHLAIGEESLHAPNRSGCWGTAASPGAEGASFGVCVMIYLNCPVKDSFLFSGQSQPRSSPIIRFGSYRGQYVVYLCTNYTFSENNHPHAPALTFLGGHGGPIDQMQSAVNHHDISVVGLEFLGLIERAPQVRRFGTDLFVSSKMPLKGGHTGFRSTLKLTAMTREAGVDLGALAKHFAHQSLRRYERK
jgi:hypothetical protein